MITKCLLRLIGLVQEHVFHPKDVKRHLSFSAEAISRRTRAKSFLQMSESFKMKIYSCQKYLSNMSGLYFEVQ